MIEKIGFNLYSVVKNVLRGRVGGWLSIACLYVWPSCHTICVTLEVSLPYYDLNTKCMCIYYCLHNNVMLMH